MNNMYFGSCLCEDVKFEVKGSFDNFYLCHCEFCQKDTGSAYAANLFSTSAQLNWITGEESIKTFNLSSTRHTKSFCENCGAALPNLQMDGKLLVVPAGSLDGDLVREPDAHIFWANKARWEDGLESINKFKKFPS